MSLSNQTFGFSLFIGGGCRGHRSGCLSDTLPLGKQARRDITQFDYILLSLHMAS